MSFILLGFLLVSLWINLRTVLYAYSSLTKPLFTSLNLPPRFVIIQDIELVKYFTLDNINIHHQTLIEHSKYKLNWNLGEKELSMITWITLMNSNKDCSRTPLINHVTKTYIPNANLIKFDKINFNPKLLLESH